MNVREHVRWGARPRLLIVDDEDALRVTIMRLLQGDGYDVTGAATGEEALARAREGDFSAAVVDVQLPDTSGLELLAPLKELHPDTELIVITGYPSQESAVQALNSGASAYVIKPLNYQELRVNIDSVLARQALVFENRRLYEDAGRELAGRERAEKDVQVSERFLDSVLNALSANVAVLDETGTIITVNDAWKQFALENGYEGGTFGLGMNYLGVCGAADGEATGEAQAAYQGIVDVMAGERRAFSLEYPCHAPTARRWYVMRVTRFSEGDAARAVVAHQDVSELRLAQEALRALERWPADPPVDPGPDGRSDADGPRGAEGSPGEWRTLSLFLDGC